MKLNLGILKPGLVNILSLSLIEILMFADVKILKLVLGQCSEVEN